MFTDLQATNAKIDNLKVGTAQILDAAITNAKIGDAEIEGAKIANATIGTANIELGAITTALIEAGAIETAQIADGSITDAKIVELTANKITSGVLSTERLIIRDPVNPENSLIYEINNITGALQAVRGDTLNGEILTERSITADRIVAASITTEEIASKTILANNIASNAITADKIDANAVTASKINVSSLSAISADIGDVTSGTITGAIVRTSAGSDRIQLTDSILEAYLNNVKRVQIDYDSLDLFTEDGGPAGSLIAMPSTEYDQAELALKGKVLSGVYGGNLDTFGRMLVGLDYGDPFAMLQASDGYRQNSISVDLDIIQWGHADSSTYASGDFTVLNGSKAATVETKDYGMRKLYTLETPDNRFVTYIKKRIRYRRTLY